jgi:hypothetical protein
LAKEAFKPYESWSRSTDCERGRPTLSCSVRRVVRFARNRDRARTSSIAALRHKRTRPIRSPCQHAIKMILKY